MTEIILFVVGSAFLVYFSRRSLPDRRAHGFYRFFAWEAILLLIIVNLKYWFRDPFSLQQGISWLLLLASIFMVIHGFWLLRQVGRPSGKVEGSANLGFENTTSLVTLGAYRFIRHPLYCSLLCLTWGACLKDLSLPSLALALVASAFLYATAKIEEQENFLRFGKAYAVYMRHTRMFIPFIF